MDLTVGGESFKTNKKKTKTNITKQSKKTTQGNQQ
jgi:hypothetical protein